MDAFRQSISRAALGIANLITPVLKESRFREEGVITPAEFVAAGDHLVHQCPTWHWESGESNYIQPYLPENKQYLCTKGVPCHKRFSQMFKVKGDENRVLEETDNDGGWIDAGFVETDDNSASNDYDQFKGENVIKGIEAIDISESKSNDSAEDDDEEPEDFDAFMQGNVDDEEDNLVVKRTTPQPTSLTEAQASESDVLQTRTYDLYITYDKVYRTARFWLTGFDEHNKPLSGSQMFEDFRQVSLLQDHANKTITMEMHPHFTGVSMPSIHPCRQAELMKRLMDKMAGSSENNSSETSTAAQVETSLGASNTESPQKRQLGVHQYLVVFLKFVQSVIPTIDYDFTRNFKF
nr:autophagy protein 3 [Hymenolepis microstoma]